MERSLRLLPWRILRHMRSRDRSMSSTSGAQTSDTREPVASVILSGLRPRGVFSESSRRATSSCERSYGRHWGILAIGSRSRFPDDRAPVGRESGKRTTPEGRWRRQAAGRATGAAGRPALLPRAGPPAIADTISPVRPVRRRRLPGFVPPLENCVGFRRGACGFAETRLSFGRANRRRWRHGRRTRAKQPAVGDAG